MDYLTFPQLRAHGIVYSRQHVAVLEKRGKFPMHFNLDHTGRRVAWETSLIKEYLAEKEKLASANAKAARAAFKKEAA